ncbi:hypothetical protein NIES2135_65270 (plasmid) [Leptolyngbya boryana NIES-2135]|jgi:hypothetical protein|uniref:Uncharacterized protein n=1 Tax=Leptolyngbya boryana NIES-2135 TaxID=1973484 RepID=A0A1Z4JSJ4_LEPBY|nr:MULTISPECIES: hypothetical protein [Leptolyngbya]BAY59650.1 hypothetical protein NIES2135_65270 [Leptolyngbya boryana NIES-2135]MBD2371166.1 fertility inhibition FinO-like protein [Leptolyngbya sp. FACHB-161]MBD2377870.1 fertility inhibition FinO-like protein [Leptolyngbya sp. FACHB-238]MBD2402308.1 fertility inhibition FinO-like protein [Leptolyngbya sp. FACHB-239]MBD2409050.1 fertility inhibition FinO-like protein [Leptolyngbya sp. FACHB-402]
MLSISGVLGPLTIKITQLPNVTVVENDWRSFTIDIGSAIVSVTVRPRIWNNWVEGTKQYQNWSAIITGRMGELTDVGFVLEQPGIQIFEAPSEPVD